MLDSWQQPPTCLVLNKQDKIEHELRNSASAALQQRFEQCCPFDRVFRTSAVRNDGIVKLRTHLLSKVRLKSL